MVLFGTLSMFLYPVLYHAGWLPFDTQSLGIYIGGTIHEVAQVVGAASNIDPATTEVATIVKMTRVALLVPVLLILGLYLRSAASHAGGSAKGAKLPIPWFAVGDVYKRQIPPPAPPQKFFSAGRDQPGQIGFKR